MDVSRPNLVTVLGPTASGKTGLAANLAYRLGGDVVSADSRQVYRGLDIGAGKDLDEYIVNGQRIPYHLIDVAGLDEEFSVFDYQKRFYEVFEALRGEGKLPVLAGGTGLYIEAVLSGYRMVEAPEDPALREELAGLTHEQLVARLRALKPDLHNTTDLTERARLVRAIEIAAYSREQEPPPAPAIRAVVLGIHWPREELRARIRRRLRARLDAGMVDEVRNLLESGVSHEKLDLLGLEYRFVAQYLRGEIKSENDLFQKLSSAIGRFAKRQMTWFRRMERRGTEIIWLDEADCDGALLMLEEAGLKPARHP